MEMSESLKQEEWFLLELLRRSIGKADEKEEMEISPDHDWNVLLQRAEEHAVLPLLYDVLAEQGSLPEPLFSSFEKKCQVTVLSNYRLLFLTAYLTRYLQEHGIRAITLKGMAVAVHYPTPELRKSGDIDFLLSGEEDCEKACELLKQEGFWLKDEQAVLHHKEMMNEEGICVELHGMLAEPFESQEMNRYMEKLLPEYQSQIVENTDWGLALYQPSESYEAFYLVLHMLQHFLRAGFGLKYLCDWVVFWNRSTEKENQESFLRLCRESGTLGFVQVMTAVCIRYLGLEKKRVTFLFEEEEKTSGKKQKIQITEAQVQGFLQDVLDAGEFGHSTNTRMVVMRGVGIWAYVREFHHQMRLNFPSAGRVFLLWPGLWLITLYRFQKNNRKVRGVSGRQIIKNAKERSRLVEGMKLFER